MLNQRARVAIELIDIAHAERGKRLVPLFHLGRRPAQRVCRLLGVDDDGRQQMRDVLIHAELETLRVDHDQPHVIRRRAEENARHHRVDADGFTRAGRSRDEQVRHRRKVGDEWLAVDGLAERHSQLRCCARVRLGLQKLAQRDLFPNRIWDLNANGRFAGNAIDQHRFRLHRETQIVGEVRDAAVLHAGIGLELVRRDHGTRMDLHD